MSSRAWVFAGTEDYFESANFFNAGHKPPPWTTGEPDLCAHTHPFHRRVSALNDKKCRVDSGALEGCVGAPETKPLAASRNVTMWTYAWTYEW